MKKILLCAAILFNASVACAEERPLVCWYNEHAGYTGAENAPANATVGKVENAGRIGDNAFSYIISAKDGSFCPVELPLGVKTAKTVPLVRRDAAACANDNVTMSDDSVTGGSVTVFRRSNGATEVALHLTGATTPSITYEVHLDCAHKLGTIRTDDKGEGAGSFDFRPDAAGEAFALEIYPEGAPAGTIFQSLQVTQK